MKVLHLSAANENTGAGKAVLSTHKELIRKGVDSKVLFSKTNLVINNIFSYQISKFCRNFT